jgi:hypothetical protein
MFWVSKMFQDIRIVNRGVPIQPIKHCQQSLNGSMTTIRQQMTTSKANEYNKTTMRAWMYNHHVVENLGKKIQQSVSMFQQKYKSNDKILEHN